MLSRFTLPLTLFVSECFPWQTDESALDQNMSNLKFSSTGVLTPDPTLVNPLDVSAALDFDAKTKV
jgi:hypothetical protein